MQFAALSHENQLGRESNPLSNTKPFFQIAGLFSGSGSGFVPVTKSLKVRGCCLSLNLDANVGRQEPSIHSETDAKSLVCRCL